MCTCIYYVTGPRYMRRRPTNVSKISSPSQAVKTTQLLTNRPNMKLRSIFRLHVHISRTYYRAIDVQPKNVYRNISRTSPKQAPTNRAKYEVVFDVRLPGKPREPGQNGHFDTKVDEKLWLACGPHLAYWFAYSIAAALGTPYR